MLRFMCSSVVRGKRDCSTLTVTTCVTIEHSALHCCAIDILYSTSRQRLGSGVDSNTADAKLGDRTRTRPTQAA